MPPRKTTPKRMSPTVQVALITALGTVAVAAITGFFTLAQKSDTPLSPSNTPDTLPLNSPNPTATTVSLSTSTPLPCIVNDFSDENTTKSNWTLESNSDSNGTDQTSLSNGKYIWSMTALTPILYSKQVILNKGVVTRNGNYELEVDIQKTTGLDSVRYGVILNYEAQSKHYTILISPAKQEVWVGKRTPGQWLTLFPYTHLEFINSNGVNNLRVVVRNSNYQVFINGNLAAEFTDTEYSNGIIQLATEITELNSDVILEIDDFRLCNIQ